MADAAIDIASAHWLAPSRGLCHRSTSATTGCRIYLRLRADHVVMAGMPRVAHAKGAGPDEPEGSRGDHRPDRCQPVCKKVVRGDPSRRERRAGKDNWSPCAIRRSRKKETALRAALIKLEEGTSLRVAGRPVRGWQAFTRSKSPSVIGKTRSWPKAHSRNQRIPSPTQPPDSPQAAAESTHCRLPGRTRCVPSQVGRQGPERACRAWRKTRSTVATVWELGAMTVQKHTGRPRGTVYGRIWGWQRRSFDDKSGKRRGVARSAHASRAGRLMPAGIARLDRAWRGQGTGHIFTGGSQRRDAAELVANIALARKLAELFSKFDSGHGRAYVPKKDRKKYEGKNRLANRI